MSLPGKPTVVAVKDDKYVIVAFVTKDAASEGKMVVVNLATKEIMKEVDLTGEPDCKLFYDDVLCHRLVNLLRIHNR